MSLNEQSALEQTYMMHTINREPVCLVKGSGMNVYDDQGKEYLDFLGGIGVCSLGHCHPAVTKAISDQAAKLIHISNLFYIEHRGQVAHMVSDLLNAYVPTDEQSPWQSFFANSGAEANECAIKLARRWSQSFGTGGSTILTLDGGFHGRTLASLAATAQPAKQERFQPLPAGFAHTPLNDCEALEKAFEQHGDEICAIMVECIQGEGGVHPCTPEFLQTAQRVAHEHKAVLICDEVQSGVYRCGRPFAFQLFGITPDIVSIAKGIASGFPMGMCAARQNVAAAFEPGDHGSTFGGSNLAVAAAHATLTTLAQEGILENAQTVGSYLREQLATLDDVVEVRGYGLMDACDLRDGIDAPTVVLKALSCGLLLNATGPHTLRFLPPLICSTNDVDVLMEKLPTIL
ncbi:MAG: aspartate aminotransferase family protein [Eggerthellaceae bacterium]|jgi:acetylornithine aminotransferase|nr:aspartate aminotransferase family protein [Eggerthellaceae bacterium]MCH4221502.1 aspartate aminotransferase family protein [Eggerthellaceae bacterium]